MILLFLSLWLEHLAAIKLSNRLFHTVSLSPKFVLEVLYFVANLIMQEGNTKANMVPAYDVTACILLQLVSW